MASSLRDGLGRGSSSDTVRVTDESKDASSVDNNSALRKSGRNSTESPLGEDNEKSEDSVANLPPLQAEMLKRQTDVPEQPYGVFSLFRYASKFDMAVMIVCTACSVVSGAATPCMMIVFGGMQDIFRDYLVLQETTLSEFKASIASFVLYFVYIAIGNFVATYTSNLGFIYIGEQLTTRLREEYVQSCLRQNVAFFDNLGAGEVAVRLTADINIIQQGISEKVGICMAAISTLISGFAIGFAFSWKLTLILLSTLVALTLNTTLFTLYFSKFTTPMAVTAAQSSSVSEETLAAIRLTTALGVQRRFVDRYDSHLVAARAAATKFKTAISFMMASAMAILWLNYGLGFWQGSTLLRRGEASLHSVITTMMAVTLSVSNAGTVAPSVQAFAEAGGRCSKIFNIIDRQSTLDPSSESGDKMGEVSGHLQFRDVKHVYPSRPGVVVMDGVSIDFPSRKTTAIVGSSGSGKSTVASLLLRLYDPLEGNISFDGADISTLNLGWLRRQIGYVSQEPTLFATSILENIGYGLVGTEHEHSGREERYNLIVEAAKQANAHEFISKLPEAYETNVGQRGSLLSGGQKQRIAIARAIVSDPKILLLDEATSALDTKSEIAIQSALDRVTRNRTTITIAHRLSTIRDAHQVVVLSGGCVVEHGTHAELVEKRGHLFDLLEAQKLGQQPVGNQLHTKEEVESDDDALFRAVSKQGAHETTEDIITQSEKLTTSTLHLLRFLFIFNKDDKGILLGALVGCIICGLAMPTHSFFFAKQMIVLPDFGIRGAPWDVQERSDFWSLMYLMLGFVQFLSNAVQAIALAYCAEKATRNLRKEAFQHILAQDMSYFDQLSNSPAALTAFLGVDTTQAASIVGSTLGNIIISLTNVIASVAVAVSFGWKLGLVCFSMVPLLFLSGFFQFWLQFKYHERIGKTHTDSAAFASEYISAMPVVASLCLEGKVAGQYGASLAAQKRQSIISVAKSSVLYAASLSMIFLCLGLGFWYGSTLLATFEYNTFQLFICLMAVVFGAQAAGSFCTYFPDIVRSRYSAIQLKALFERQPTVDHRRGSGQRLQEVQGRVEFHNVSFQYGEGRPVLQKLNLTVQPNQHVGIVGPSGSGKSTLISLMERFYDPTEGKITVDGHDISTLNVNQYRGTIGLVNQQPTLFQGTIRENLLMGSSNPGEEVSEATIRKACQDANIYDFIISLPDGFDTLCGIGGTLLSGGQKQRIAIARALVRSPRILLLDEATSALDSESEHVVQVALQNSVQGRTTISIAHRLSTIQHADAIHVLDGGTVVESGSHEELMRRGGRYAEMVRLQSTSSTT